MQLVGVEYSSTCWERACACIVLQKYVSVQAAVGIVGSAEVSPAQAG
jgi:hypothetical protein